MLSPPSSGSCGISPLNHEAINDAVKHDAVIIAFWANPTKFWTVFGVALSYNSTSNDPRFFWMTACEGDCCVIARSSFFGVQDTKKLVNIPAMRTDRIIAAS